MFRVAIVGRPNVGKSTVFNRLCGSRKAIVGDEPGMTRDRILGLVRWGDRSIELIDTGGMMPGVREVIPVKILEQVEKAIGDADLLLFVVDGRAGVTASDEQLLPLLRKSGRPFWILVNKLDVPELESYTSPFYVFGAQEVFPISAEHGRGIGELLDALAERSGKNGESDPRESGEEIAVAVVGRPNVGKSSLVNRLCGFERTIVSEIPGTTRDSVDTLLVREGISYRMIDTAGIRRKGRTDARAEKISVVMARKNLELADVALLLVDAGEGVTKLDSTIGGYAAEAGCSVLIVLNKWDLVQKDEHTLVEFTEKIRRRMKHLSYAPIITVSAMTGQRVSKIFELIGRAREGRLMHVPTGTLNNIFVPDLSNQWSASDPTRKLNIRYITQARSATPTFVVFTSGREPLHFSTERFLVNELRKRFGFYATPIRIKQRVKPAKGMPKV